MATTTAAAAAAAAAVSQMAPYTSLWSSVAEWFTPTVFFVLLNVVIGTIAVTSKSLSHHAHGAKPAADHHHQQLYGTGAGADVQHVQYHDAAPPPPTRQLSRTGSMLQRLKSFNLNFHMYRAGYHRPEDYGLVAAPAVDVHVGVEAGSVPKEPQQQQQKKPAKKNPKPRALRDPSPPRRDLPSQDHHQQHHHHLPEEEEALGNVAASDGAAEFETLEEAFLAASGGSSSNTHLNRIQSDTHPTAGERPRKLAATMKKSASTKSAFAHFEPEDLPRRPATTRDTQGRRHNLLDPAAEDDGSRSNEQYGDADDQPRPNAEVDERADDFINRFRQQLKLQRLESLMRYSDMLNRGR